MTHYKPLSFIILLSTLVFACSDDDNVNPPVVTVDSNSDYFLTDSSNYWIYETYSVDTNGQESFISRDTVNVRTENLNGTDYIVYRQGNPLTPRSPRNDFYVRDSSGYMLARYSNKVLFSATDLNTVLSVDSTQPHLYQIDYKMVQDSVPLTVHSGTYSNVLTYQGKVVATNGATLFFPAVRYTKKSYAKGVGMVYEKFFFFSRYYPFYERRLVEYQVN